MAFQHSALLASVIASGFLQATAGAADRLVPQQYPTIQAAIDASTNGDIVVVAPGNSWQGFTSTGKSLTIRSTGFAAGTRVVSACTVGAPAAGQVVLQGFMFLAQLEIPSGRVEVRDTVHVAQQVAIGSNAIPTLVGCQFSGTGSTLRCLAPNLNLSNVAFQSGDQAIDALASSVQMTNCSFIQRRSTSGASICVLGSTGITGCSFLACAVDRGAAVISGGAVRCVGNLQCIDSEFEDCVVYNRVDDNGTSHSRGGAIWVGGQATIERTTFKNCGVESEGIGGGGFGGFSIAAEGGAVFAQGLANTLTDCEFVGCDARWMISLAAPFHNATVECRGASLHLREGVVARCSFEGSLVTQQPPGWGTILGEIRCQGAALYCPGGALQLDQCSFIGGKGAPGSAIAGWGFTANRCLFLSNGAAQNQSACVITAGTSLNKAQFSQCGFQDNLAIPASILVGQSPSTGLALIDACTFCGPVTSEIGGSWISKRPSVFSANCQLDCDEDGLADSLQVAVTDDDTDGNGQPDSCDTPTCESADIYRDFHVNGADLGVLLAQWGPASPTTQSDLDRNGVVNGDDLGLLLSFWGPCP